MDLKYFFPVILIIVFFQTPSLRAQEYRIGGKSIMELKNERLKLAAHPVFFSAISTESIPKQLPQPLDSFFKLAISDMPKVYSYDELGMFCKFEVQLEKATKFPVKIRLGEVEAVDRKEGKWQYDNWNK